jgi:hypothetical protein
MMVLPERNWDGFSNFSAEDWGLLVASLILKL